MIVRCWGCGQDHEVSTESARAEERQRILDILIKDADLSGICGDIYRHNALMSAVDLIEHSR